MEKEKKIVRYKLRCLHCDYEWDTRYPKIPASCPSCKQKIYNTDKYKILTEYTEGCFIATAAFGTKMQGEIDVLRTFRDETLLNNNFGKDVVLRYYQFSPPIAELIAKSELLRFVVRCILYLPIMLLKRFKDN